MLLVKWCDLLSWREDIESGEGTRISSILFLGLMPCILSTRWIDLATSQPETAPTGQRNHGVGYLHGTLCEAIGGAVAEFMIKR